MNDLERFIACMDYQPGPRPMHEIGPWAQARELWKKEAPDRVADFTWNWFVGEPELGLDHREYINVDFGFRPTFPYKKLEETDRYIIARNQWGMITRTLKEGAIGGASMSMDEYMEFPVKTPEDFADIRQRMVAGQPERYPADLDEKIAQWKKRDFPLVLGLNCSTKGFYWRAREWMGTENLSYAWYDMPDLMHEMMEFIADFTIETARPVLEKINVEYVNISEDCAMKSGPLLGPDMFKTFIYPHLKRLVSFFKSNGVRYVVVDSDGNPEVLVPQFLDAGVDGLWPMERASNANPMEWRKKFGRSMRYWGGVDKRVLPRGPQAIREHLREMIPLIEEGGFIPTVDHMVPPDVSWDNFQYYMEAKRALLNGDFAALED